MIIIKDKKAVYIDDIGWCWIEENTTDCNGFDYCVTICSEQESYLLG